MFDSLLVVILAICGLAAFRLLRRRSVWDLPILSVLAVFVVAALVGLGESDWKYVGITVALIGALAVNTVPLPFRTLAERAWVRGRFSSARRHARLAWLGLPTAGAYLFYRSMKAMAKLDGARRPVALAELETLRQRALRLGDHGLARVLDDLRVGARIGKEPRAVLAGDAETFAAAVPFFATPPRYTGALLADVLGRSGRLDDAAKLVGAMGDPEDPRRAFPAIADAFRARARLSLLASAGRTDAVEAALRSGSSLRSLVTVEARQELASRARARTRAAAPVLDEQTPLRIAECAEAVRVEAGLPSGASSFGRPAPATGLLLLFIVGVHAIMALGGWDHTIDYVRLGACLPVRVHEGELWRLFSSMMLHANWPHLALNAAFLLYFGNLLERLIGSWRFLAVYLLAGLSGSLVFLAFPEGPIMVGASGAVFGLMGGVVAAISAQRRRLPASWARRNLRVTRGLVVANLALGFVVEFIAGSAHIGGCVGGWLATWALLQVLSPKGSPPGARRAGALATAVAWAVCVGATVLGISGQLALPVGDVIPMESHQFEVQGSEESKEHVATVEVTVPSLWQRQERDTGREVLYGPIWMGAHGIWAAVVVECGAPADPGAEEGWTLVDEDDEVGRRYIAKRYEPAGTLEVDLRFRATPPDDARALIATMLAGTHLIECRRR